MKIVFLLSAFLYSLSIESIFHSLEFLCIFLLPFPYDDNFFKFYFLNIILEKMKGEEVEKKENTEKKVKVNKGGESSLGGEEVGGR